MSLREPDVLKELRCETMKLTGSQMQISPEQGQLMALLIELINARKTLELGVYTGYSSLAVALAMPDDGKMECKYTENERKAVAQYYKDVATAESVGTSVNANLGSGEQKTTYTINGKVVDNPLQEAMSSGVCVISGY